jgi:MYXO-CTERM domain-containing protein
VRRLVFALTLATLYAPAVAHGNGRFPKAQAIATLAGDDAHTLVMRATFGMLLSHDGGKSWRWLCEQAYGGVSTWDPPFALTRDGSLWIGMPDGMRVTRDGCTVDSVAAFDGETVADFAAGKSAGLLFAATSTPGKPAALWRRRGDGPWDKRGTIPGLHIDTLEVAPSRETRVYVTGVTEGTRTTRLFRSDDAGASFVEIVPSLPVRGRLFLASVDPKSPDRLLVRVLHDAGSELVVSTDAGTTFQGVLHMKGAMFGFAKSEDGATVWAGSGDPKEGIWRSRDRGVHWEPMAKTGVFCLQADGPKLFACSNPYVPGGYAVAVSTDGGATVTSLATFEGVDGPVACDAGTGTKCVAAWPETKGLLARGSSEETAPAASTTTATSTSTTNANASANTTSSARGCGCTTASVPSPPWPLLALLLTALRRRKDGSLGPQRG